MGGELSRSAVASQSAERARFVTATVHVGRSASGAAPPPTREADASSASSSDSRAPEASDESLRALPELRASERDHPEHGDLLRRFAADEGGERRLEGSVDELVDPERPRHRVAAAGLHVARIADEDSRLWAAEELVAGEDHEVDAAREASSDRRFVGEPVGRERQEVAASEVLDDGERPLPAETG